jgi:hypothetical protein
VCVSGGGVGSGGGQVTSVGDGHKGGEGDLKNRSQIFTLVTGPQMAALVDFSHSPFPPSPNRNSKTTFSALYPWPSAC